MAQVLGSLAFLWEISDFWLQSDPVLAVQVFEEKEAEKNSILSLCISNEINASLKTLAKRII